MAQPENSRKIISRIGPCPSSTDNEVQDSITEVASVLVDKEIEHDGILLSVDTGIAYAFKNKKAESTKGTITA